MLLLALSARAAIVYVGSATARLDAIPTNGSAGALVVSKPAIAKPGMVMIVSIAARPSQMTWTVPAGWTELSVAAEQTGGGTSTSPGGMTMRTYYRIVTAYEPVSYTWTLANTIGAGASGGGSAIAGMLVFSGVDTSTNPLDATPSSRLNPSDDIHRTTAITTATNGAMVVSMMSYLSAGNFAYSGTSCGTTEALDASTPTGSTAIGTTLQMGYFLKATAGLTCAPQATANGNDDTGVGHLLALKPSQRDLTLSMSRSGPLIPGSTASYTLTVNNAGSLSEPGPLTIVDTLPTGLTYASSSGGWTCSVAGQIVSCTLNGSLAAGANAPALVINVNVAAGLTGVITNTATGSGTGGDGNTANNTAIDNYVILPSAYAYYAMDESTWPSAGSTVLDSSGNGRNAAILGLTTVPTGNPPSIGAAISGNPGTCGAGRIPNATSGVGINTNIDVNSIGNAGTLMFWYYSSAAWNDGTARLLFDASNELGNGGADRHFFLVKDGSGILRFALEDSSDTDSTAVSSAYAFGANTWHHIAVTWDMAADRLYIYLDGDSSPVATSTTNVAATLSDMATLYLGAQRFTTIAGTPTGYSSNSANGYLDEVRMYNRALQPLEIEAAADLTHACTNTVEHVEFVHDGSALTCTAEAITVLACTTAASCYGITGNQSTSGSVTVTLPTIAGAQWCLDDLCAATLSNPVALTNNSIIYLRDTNVRTDDIGGTAAGTSTAAVQCYNTSNTAFNATTACDLPFESSGFLVSLPDHRSCTSQVLTVKAVRSNNNNTACVPTFRNQTRTEKVSFAYNNPASGTMVPSVAGTPISTAGVNISLTFDNTGTATPSFVYQDAGKLSISVDDPNLPLTGSTTTLPTIAPANFVFSGIPSAPLTAGLPFNATVTAKNACATPATTPNFRSAAVAVTSSNAVPGTGNATAINATIPSFTSGAASINLIWNEVGTIDLSADLANYLSASPALPVSGSAIGVGRFKPAYFDTIVTGGCGNFTYAGLTGTPTLAGQPLTVAVKAKRYGGDSTNSTNTANYAGAIWAKSTTLSDAGTGSGTLTNTALLATNFVNGIGTRNNVTYSFANKQTAPYTLVLRAVDSDTPATSSSGHSEGSTAMRSGRLRLANAYGSAKTNLALPVQADYWSGSSWVINSADSCTTVPASAFSLVSPPTGVAVSGAVSLASGAGTLTLTPPAGGASGSVDLAANLGAAGSDNSCLTTHGGTAANLPWLRSRNGTCATTFDRDPSARTSFGVYPPESQRSVHVRETF